MIHSPAIQDDGTLEKTQLEQLQMTTTAWLTLYEEVSRFVRRRVGNAMDAEDIVQRGFLKLYQHLHTLRDERRVRAWIYATARNGVTDYYRARARQRTVAAEPLDVVAPETPVAASQRLAECVPSLIDRLGKDDARALKLIDIDGTPQGEAARTFNVSLSGMKSRVQRARRRLKSEVESCCDVRLDMQGAIAAFEKRTADACACGGSCGC